MLKLTSAAVGQVLAASKQSGTEGMSLRLAAQRKPDGAIDYRMGFDDVGEDDIRINCDGVDVVIAPEHVPLFDQAVMDYVEIEPGQFHFIFLNPKDPNYQAPTEA